jgi:hypothetical protein
MNLRRSVDELIRIVSSKRDAIADSRVRRLASLTAELEQHPVLGELTQAVVDRATVMLDGLAKPKAIYHGEAHLFEALTGAVNRLENGDSLFAVCSDKNWQSPYVHEYFRANAIAAKRGVRISRIFYETDSDQVIREAQRQAAIGIHVRVLRKECLKDLRPLHHIPPALAIAIFNDSTVILHSGPADRAYGCKFERAELASLVRSQFEVVEGLAEPIGSSDFVGGSFGRFRHAFRELRPSKASLH